MNRVILLCSVLLMVFGTTLTQAQSPTRCASHQHTQRLHQDHDWHTAAEGRSNKLTTLLQQASTRSTCSQTLYIPVAIHFQGVDEANRPCLERMAQEQIEQLNADYNGSSAKEEDWEDISAVYFPKTTLGESCIQFQLASKNHPEGYQLADGQTAITINQTSGDFAADWTGYLNIFVRNISDLGYAPEMGAGNGDGVTISFKAFGTGRSCGQIAAKAPYDNGRTLTHEIGHYFSLKHIWGTGGCNSDDEVNDTPKAAGSSFGCPTPGRTSCEDYALYMNFMDYTNDACMYMFTIGQTNRMQAYVNANLQHLLDKAISTLDDAANILLAADDCAAPTQLNAYQQEDNIILSWKTDNTTEFEIQYQLMGSTDWTKVSTQTTVYTLQNLSQEGFYQWRVRSACQDDHTDWSYEAFEYTPLTRASANQGQNLSELTSPLEVSTFPNPTIEYVTVSTHIGATLAEYDVIIMIHDLYGKRLQFFNEAGSGKAGDYKKRLDLTQLPAGQYSIFVCIGPQRLTKKVIKQ